MEFPFDSAFANSVLLPGLMPVACRHTQGVAPFSLQDKPPSTEVLQLVVLEWIKKRKRQKRKAQQEYQFAKWEYEERMAELETILAARQACVRCSLSRAFS